jgi:hypothetical protein
MRPAAVPIETTEGTFAQVLTDITCVLAVSDHPHARLARTLELLRKVVPYRDSALLIRAASDRPWFITVPVSNPESNDLRVRLQRLLQTVSDDSITRSAQSRARFRIRSLMDGGPWLFRSSPLMRSSAFCR